MKKLTVEYTGGLDGELDKKIRNFFKELGWNWIGQGMEIETQIREIVFERKEG